MYFFILILTLSRITLWGGPANLKLNFPTPFTPVSLIERCNTDTIVCCSGCNIYLYRISTDEQGIPTLTPSFSLVHTYAFLFYLFIFIYLFELRKK